MCKAMGREDLLTNERYATSGARYQNRDELNAVIESITKDKPSEDWIKLLNDAGVPCGPVNSIDQTFADEQVQFLEMAQSVTSPALGELNILGHPVSWNSQRNPLRKSAPELGEDNHVILTGLGYSADEIAGLEQDGVI